MVDPTEDMQNIYTFLLSVEEEIINKLQHGTTYLQYFLEIFLNENRTV